MFSPSERSSFQLVSTEQESSTTDVPEQGQLVEVRKRQFVVSDVYASDLPPNPLVRERAQRQYRVSLSSVEDDALGEELEVIWDIEPGARILEKAGLPEVDGFDEPDRLDAFLNAVRWGAVTDADFDALQSPFRSGIDIEDYQLDPVVRAIQMPRANLLIADDVGLGKTIEAGLVVQELLLRHRARTVLIVCPASLQTKWKEEMRDKFGLDFRIVDTDCLRRLRRERGIHTNPWTHHPRLITSIDWLKRETPMRMFRDVLPPRPTYPREFDILIVDEAHNVAPSGSGHYAVDSLRTKAVRTLAPHFEHRLFLTATPHNGYQVSFTALLEMLDDQRFARGITPDQEQLETVMVRRLKDDIVDWKGEPVFPERRLDTIEIDYSDEERDIHRALAEYTRSRRESAQADGQHATEFVLKLLKKRLFSSPAAFATTLAKHRETLQTPQDKGDDSASLGILERAIGEAEEDHADDDEYETALEDAVAEASTRFDGLSKREKELLDEMWQWAEQNRSRPNSKFDALLSWLNEHVRPGGDWSNERVILFTEYRATQDWLVRLLAAHGFGERERLHTIYGGMDADEREKIKAAFQAHPDESDVRILLATDAASEGIDLQNFCNRMIHVEIPWNPNVLEQRNGRIDRHGQRESEVYIYHFVGSGWEEATGGEASGRQDFTGDLEFLFRAAEKVQAIREDLGRVGPVIAQQVEEAMLGARSYLDTSTAEKKADAERRLLRIERRFREKVDRLHERLLETKRRLELSPSNVRRVVDAGLELAGQPPLRTTSIPGIDEKDEEVFETPHLRGTWKRCLEGLAHPHTGARRPITFDHDIASGRDDVVLVHLRHRLVRMCLRHLRAEVWSRADARDLHRVTARVVPSSELDVPGVIGHARLVVIGDDRHRLHEEIIRAGGVFRRGRFARFSTVSKVDRLLERSSDYLPPPGVLERLEALWPEMEASLYSSLEARMRDRMQYLSNTIDRRKEREIEDVREILSDLRESILSELEGIEGETQLALWSTDERQQLERNIESLRGRVEEIPAEIDREIEAVRQRYQTPAPRLFPVALTFVVPESMSE